MSSAATASTALTVAGASAAKAGATTTSVGIGTAAPRAVASAMIRLAVSSRSRSTSDLPTPWPIAAMNVLAMPPPTINWSTLPTRVSEQGQLGRHLGAGDDRQQRPRRVLQRLGQRIEFGHQQRAAARDLGVADRAVRRGLRAMRGAERVHHEDIAQRRVFFRQRVVVLALADVHAAVLEQHQLPRLHVDAVDPVAQQRHLATEQLTEPLRDRRQRILLAPLSFLRTAEVRRDHHGGAFLQRQLQASAARRAMRVSEVMRGGWPSPARSAR